MNVEAMTVSTILPYLIGNFSRGAILHIYDDSASLVAEKQRSSPNSMTMFVQQAVSQGVLVIQGAEFFPTLSYLY